MENIDKEWRKQKANELKSISNHEKRSFIWNNYKKETEFLREFVRPEYGDEYDTLEVKNHMIFNHTDFLLDQFNKISFPFDISDHNDVFIENLANEISYPYSRSNLSEIEETANGIVFAYWVKRMKDVLLVDDENVDLQKILYLGLMVLL